MAFFSFSSCFMVCSVLSMSASRSAIAPPPPFILKRDHEVDKELLKMLRRVGLGMLLLGMLLVLVLLTMKDDFRFNVGGIVGIVGITGPSCLAWGTGETTGRLEGITGRSRTAWAAGAAAGRLVGITGRSRMAWLAAG